MSKTHCEFRCEESLGCEADDWDGYECIHCGQPMNEPYERQPEPADETRSLIAAVPMNLFGAMQEMLNFALTNPPTRFSGDGSNPAPGRTTETSAVWQSNGLALQATFSPEDQGDIRLSAVSLYEYPIG